MTAKRTGTCPACSQVFVIRKDGTVRDHNDPFRPRDSFRTHLCPGVGQLPEEAAK